MTDLLPTVARAVFQTEEVVTLEDLTAALTRKAKPRGYIGVEPTGLMHLGHTIWVQKLRTLSKLGVKMHVLLATWHAKINDKFGGNIDQIRRCAEYLRHCLSALGVNLREVRVVTAEDLMKKLEYWEDTLRVAKSLTLARVRRSMTIMGRSGEDVELDFSKLIYPCLQVSDIINQRFEICLGGMDQRRAHVLAREVADKLKLGWKPIGIHTPLVSGLSGTSRMEAGPHVSAEEVMIATKMSKSKPDDSILIHDLPKEIMKKLRNAYCPAREVNDNPVLSYVNHLLFSQEDYVFKIERAPKHGGSLSIRSCAELRRLYASGEIHPLDLKQATAKAIAKLLGPVRKYFDEKSEAKEILTEVSSYSVTR
ncbi:MAG: tyrosine--tRNA ligase [Promethearchaeota archaeon]